MASAQFETQTCDRCGKERNVPIGRAESAYHYTAEQSLSAVHFNGQRSELCDKCAADFERWLESAPAKAPAKRRARG